jgi:ankyrin repeat protein
MPINRNSHLHRYSATFNPSSANQFKEKVPRAESSTGQTSRTDEENWEYSPVDTASSGAMPRKTYQEYHHSQLAGRDGRSYGSEETDEVSLTLRDCLENLILSDDDGEAERLQTALVDYELNAHEHEGLSALHVAARHDLQASVKLLLERDTEVDRRTIYEEKTALHLAAENGHEEVVVLLLDSGANVDAKTWMDEKTPLFLAAENGHVNLAMLLLNAGADPIAKVGELEDTPFHVAAREGYESIVQFFLECGVPVNSETKFGSLALHRAARAGKEGVVQLLLSYGTKIDAEDPEDEKDMTALQIAACEGHEAVVRILLQFGADPYAKTIKM